jgi:hypothetical protein
MYAQSLRDLRRTPEGEIIWQAMRGKRDVAHVAALQAAAASKYAWSHDALELSIRSDKPSISSQPDVSLYQRLTGALVYDVSVENCRYYTPLLKRMAKEDVFAFGVTKLLGRANTPESAAALGKLADTDDIAKPTSLANKAISELVSDVSEAVAQPVVLGLVSHGHSAVVRQMAANVWANRHQALPSPPPSIQSFIKAEEKRKVTMAGMSAAELASVVAGQNQHEADMAIKALADKAEQHPQEVRSALDKVLESTMPKVRVRLAAILLDIDSQLPR